MNPLQNVVKAPVDQYRACQASPLLLIEYMRKLGYEDPRDKRIDEMGKLIAAIEHGIRFEWEDHTGEVSSGVEKLINNWKEQNDE